MRKKSQPIIEIPVMYVVITLGVIGVFSIVSTTFLLMKQIGNSSKHVLSSHIVNISLHPKHKTTNTLPFFASSIIQTASSTAIATPLPETTRSVDYCLAVPILMYHHVQPLAIAKKLGHDQLTVDSRFFEQQLAYLDAQGYQSLTSEQLVSALLEHTPLPSKSVLVTLDDGYDDMYGYAFPILKKYHVIGNFMIPTGLMGVSGYLTWDELKDMVKSPYVRVYNHTWSHADLSHVPHDKIESEIAMSQSQLSTNLGIKPTIMAYPYGSFSDDAKSVLREHGFIAAFSTIGGFEQCESQILELRRVHAENTAVPPLSF